MRVTATARAGASLQYLLAGLSYGFFSAAEGLALYPMKLDNLARMVYSERENERLAEIR